MFDTILGLPVHPLIVHAAVVLLPLVAIGVIALGLRPVWRARFAVPLLGLLVIAACSAVVAMASGDKLAERVGNPGRHEGLGEILGFGSIAFLLLAGGWLWWVRRDNGDEEGPAARKGLGWAAALASVAVLALTAMVGHTGATAAWSDAVAQPAAPATSTAGAQTTAPLTTAEPAPSSPSDGYTMAMLEEHNTPDDCWAAVNGSMYDLTEWIAQHPGGADRIINLCGTDATAAFSQQHEGQANPADALSRYLLGPVS